jgi:hypothetical protein
VPRSGTLHAVENACQEKPDTCPNPGGTRVVGLFAKGAGISVSDRPATRGNWRVDNSNPLSRVTVQWRHCLRDKAFEWYAVDQVLKDRDLSDEEINSGNLGGGDDGGVDALYLFIGDQLVRDETTIYPPAEAVELVLLQATRETGFKEDRVDKFNAFCRDLFDYSKPVDSIVYLNSMARDAISRFRTQYDRILASNVSGWTSHLVSREA